LAWFSINEASKTSVASSLANPALLWHNFQDLDCAIWFGLFSPHKLVPVMLNAM
jgi:hypothetical protein